jgi:hypothetical protein
MRSITTNFVVHASHDTRPALRVTEPVRQIDIKEKRRQRVAKLSKIVNHLHKDTLARLAK